MLKKQLKELLKLHNTELSETLKSDLLALLTGTLQRANLEQSTVFTNPIHLGTSDQAPQDVIPSETWSFDADYLRCANRYYYDSYTRYDRLGFRLGRNF
jgi:hypothetical protein